MDWTSTTTPPPLRIGGHRGAPDLAPENTFAGFDVAAALEVDYLELDVRRTVDGGLVILHDAQLDRTTNSSGLVSDMQLVHVAELDAGGWFSNRFLGQRVPTLDAFLRWIEARAPLGAIVEAKAPGVGAEIAQRIAGSPAREHLAICSFLPDEILAAKAAEPGVPCVLLFQHRPPAANPLDVIAACGADGADVPWQWLTPDLVAAMRGRGLLVGGGTANDVAVVEHLMTIGADFVDSDSPGMAVQARNARD
jgi:glycerophosphoryl diester phosphodiesterase